MTNTSIEPTPRGRALGPGPTGRHERRRGPAPPPAGRSGRAELPLVAAGASPASGRCSRRSPRAPWSSPCPDILRDLHTDLFSLLWIVVGYTLVVTGPGAQRRPAGRHRSGGPGPTPWGWPSSRSPRCSAPSPRRRSLLILGRVAPGRGRRIHVRQLGGPGDRRLPALASWARRWASTRWSSGAGLILGPILGGWLTGFGWRFVFWFNVPLGLIGIVAALLILVEKTPAQRSISIDWLGSGALPRRAAGA